MQGESRRRSGTRPAASTRPLHRPRPCAPKPSWVGGVHTPYPAAPRPSDDRAGARASPGAVGSRKQVLPTLLKKLDSSLGIWWYLQGERKPLLPLCQIPSIYGVSTHCVSQVSLLGGVACCGRMTQPGRRGPRIACPQPRHAHCTGNLSYFSLLPFSPRFKYNSLPKHEPFLNASVKHHGLPLEITTQSRESSGGEGTRLTPPQRWVPCPCSEEVTKKDISMKAQLCLFNMENVFSKRGQLNFLS